MSTSTALWINDAILAVTAFLVGWYAVATQTLVRTSQRQVQVAQDQLKELQKQLSVSQEQVRASLQQVESQSKPAIIVREEMIAIESPMLRLVNIGTGQLSTSPAG